MNAYLPNHSGVFTPHLQSPSERERSGPMNDHTNQIFAPLAFVRAVDLGLYPSKDADSNNSTRPPMR